MRSLAMSNHVFGSLSIKDNEKLLKPPPDRQCLCVLTQSAFDIKNSSI